VVRASSADLGQHVLRPTGSCLLQLVRHDRGLHLVGRKQASEVEALRDE
jgi:hypothetical protein